LFIDARLTDLRRLEAAEGHGAGPILRPMGAARGIGSSAGGPQGDVGGGLTALTGEVVNCRKCPRLVAWREEAARRPPKRYEGSEYWARPLPGFGDPEAGLLIVGLAPAAHGGNRTGRIFTGDRSGDWLFRSLHRTGYANHPVSTHRGDGLRLTGAYIAAVNRCPPPGNRPTPTERDNCLPYLARELALLRRVSVLVALGSFAWDGALRAVAAIGHAPPRPRPAFAHGAEARVGPYVLVGSYHPSQQNTFTGVLTEEMLDAVFNRARTLEGSKATGRR
jgi:uracil-DNA glycosylase family 4